MFKELVLLALCVAIGFAATLYILAPATLLGGVAALQSQAQPLLDTWNGLDNNVKLLGIGGVTTAVTMFMAWTKNRAVTNMQQTQVQLGEAGQAIHDKTLETTQLQTAYATLQAEHDALKDAAPNMAALIAERDALNTQLTDTMRTNTTLTQKNTTLTQALAVKQNFTVSDLKTLAARLNCTIHERTA